MQRAVHESYRLSPLQEGMVFHHLEGTNVGVDIEQFVGDLDERIDVDLLRQAWATVAARHPILRTQFRWTGVDRPLQDVVVSVETPLSVVDHAHLDEAARALALDEFLEQDRRAGFALDAAPLWRVTVLRGPASDHLVFTYHHALLDTSVVWCTEEVFRVYDGLRTGQAVSLEERRPYREHIEWLHQHLEDDRATAAEYFRELLDGVEEPTRLTALESPGSPDRVTYGADRFRLDVELSGRLHALGAELAVGVPAIVEAAWALVLAAFSGTTDVVFGSTRGCRRTGLPGSDRTMGLFINTPPVRVILDPAATVRSLLTAVRQQQVAKRAHEHTPLADVQAAVGSRGTSLFETIVVVNELHQGTRLRHAGPAFEGRRFDLHDQTNFPLTLLAYLDPQIHGKLSYDRRRFDDDAIVRVRTLLVAVLEALAADPDRPVGELPTVPPGDLMALAGWNDTARPYPAAACVHQLFEAQVDRTPDATALVFRGERLTYRQLDQRADAVAAHLRGLGVGPDSLVGVFVERSVEMVVGLLGVLKAGGAYVPMDPAYPSNRIAMMLEDANAQVVLTLDRLRGSVPGAVNHVVALDQPFPASPRTATPGLRSDHLAYVIFTSGSTGRPKGVMVEHRNVVNFFVGMDESLGHDEASAPGTWLGVTSISFDISVLELFWTLTRGFTLVVQEDDKTLARGPVAAAAPSRPVSFSLFYFSADAAGSAAGSDRYRLLLEGARFADEHGFDAVWTPERHFHPFGGLYPNAALTSAAVAMVTSRIAIRAGSVVLPLHNPIRAAEDWSVVDNLSNGRVGLSFASGWHANDFVLAPDNFADRRRLMAEGIETVLALWRGEAVTAPNGEGRETEVRMYPPPVQQAPPVWITAGGSPDTFAMAGRLGASILTNLLVMNRDDLVRNVAVYRQAFRAAGHAGDGHVTVMLHTHVGTDDALVRQRVRQPFLDYLRTSTDLINQVRWERTSFAKPDASAAADDEGLGSLDQLGDDEMAALMDHAFERYVRTAGLFGTPDTCAATVAELADLGVDEIACLIDFGLPDDDVLGGLTHLDELRRRCAATAVPVAAAMTDGDADDDGEATYDLVSQLARHDVTHLQCTPSHAQLIAATPGGLAALSGLTKLLLGGEALPPAVVDQIRPVLRGELLNMYGPTETTIWSTVSPIERAGVPITIGRPIANTDVHIVDRALRPLPIGVAGELTIGGAGVVRGYLDRAELTAERFVTLPHTGERAYRTGDLARLLPDGEIEFGGRLDHQVKIRGYRIELGEIEAAIGRHAGVFEQVVVARADGGGDPRLVAYVVPTPDAGGDAGDAWGQVWDETYRTSDADDLTFDVAGWASTYTGEQIADAEMREWVDDTVDRIVELAPRRVLEIGCGTGLLLFRVAPSCERYVGVDAAASALDRIGRQLQQRPLPQVELLHGLAGQVASLVEGPFDTVVVNSVAQYFGDADELVDVIRQALALLRPGGSLFLGDLRSLPMQPLFAAAVELEHAAADMGAGDLRERAAARVAQDNELVVDPALFPALAQAWPEVGAVRVRLKAGRADNELTRFRYDVVVERAADGAAAGAPAERVVDGVALGADALRAALAGGPDAVRVVGVRNARLVREAELVRLLEVAGAPATVAELRAALAAVPAGVHPDDALALAAEAAGPAYRVDAVWSAEGPDRFDLVLRSAASTAASSNATPVALRPWTGYTNRPARRSAASLVPELRSSLRTVLPDFMVPSAFVVLDALPRTPNGKIDRNALPAPERGRSEGEATAPPANELERTIATVWQDMLSLDAVGVETNLFDLGANSLMMVKASARLAETLGRAVSLVDLFRYPTVRALAAHLADGGDEADSEVLQGSHDRAQARKDAMARRRDARAGVRPGRRG